MVTKSSTTKSEGLPADLAEAKQARSRSRTAHPAGKAAPAKKPAPAKAAAKAPAKAAAATPAAEKRTYAATGRGGVTRTATSTGVLSHAVDVKIAGRKAAHFADGAVVQFYASEAAAKKAADAINAGAAGKDWSAAVVVKVAPVTTAVSA